MLVINDEQFAKRAEILWEKGTNRAAFFRGEVDKYGWVDIGSSFLPSEIIAAFLYAQLEHLEQIQQKRRDIWNYYNDKLGQWASENDIDLPFIPDFATNNGHLFYMVCKNLEQRTQIVEKLKTNGILSVFHYLSLHQSQFYRNKHTGSDLPQSNRYSDCLLRLPLFFELSTSDITRVCDVLKSALI